MNISQLSRRILPLWSSIAILSCASPTGPDPPFRSLEESTPIVTGLRITNPHGPTELAEWRSPSDPASPQSFPINIVPKNLGFQSPFPNPGDSVVTLVFAVGATVEVSIWVVRAQGPGGGTGDLSEFSGGNIYAPYAIVVKKLISAFTLQAGFHEIRWDTRDDQGNLLKSGFYRICFQAGDNTTFHDIVIYRALSELPPDLGDLVVNRYGG